MKYVKTKERFMRWLINSLLLLSVTGFGTLAQADMAYVAHAGVNNVSVIDTSTDKVVATILVSNVYDVAVNLAGTRVYVANGNIGGTVSMVSVIDTSINQVVATIPVVGNSSGPIAVNPTGNRVYVAGYNSGYVVNVIDTGTNSVIATIPTGHANDIVINPADTRVYVATGGAGGMVSVIDTSTNKVAATIPLGTWQADSMIVNPTGTRLRDQ
jgi:YVTN family beta-propeller protein